MVIAATCTVLIAMAALAFANHQAARKAFITEAMHTTRLIIDGTAGEINGWLQNKKNIVQALAPAASSYYPLAVLDQARESGDFVSSLADQQTLRQFACSRMILFDPPRPGTLNGRASGTTHRSLFNADSDQMIATVASP